MSEKGDQIDLVLVGAPPPPWHGQALVTEQVFKADWSPWRVERVEARFSESIDEVGGLRLKKLGTLIKVAWELFGMRVTRRARVLYLTAGSANWVPLLRDVILCGILGRLYDVLVIHYHSGGLPDWFRRHRLAGFLGRLAYGGAEVAIGLSREVEVPCFGDTRLAIVPNGLDAPDPEAVEAERDGRFTVLFIGALRESKGVSVLLEAARQLSVENYRAIRFRFLGGWISPRYEQSTRAFVAEHGLGEMVTFEGVVTGDRKWQILRGSDLFAFPSFYEAENQPLVVIEAMAMGLPVLASHWRGIPELLRDGETGFLTEPGNVGAVTDILRRGVDGELDVAAMGRAARECYLETFTKAAFLGRMSATLAPFLPPAAEAAPDAKRNVPGPTRP